MHRYTGKLFFLHFSNFPLLLSLSLVPSYVDRVQYRSRFSNTKPRSRRACSLLLQQRLTLQVICRFRILISNFD